MNLIKFAASCAAVAVMAFAASVNADEIEIGTNGDFEGPIGPVGGGAIALWNPFVGPGAAGAGTGTTAPLDGATHAVATLDAAEGSFAGFQFQIDGITVGEDYSFGFQARSEAASLGGIDGEFRIEWLDAGGAFVGGQFDNNQSLNSVTDSYAAFSQTITAPTGAESLRAVFAVQSFGSGVDGTNSNSGTLFVDAASIQGPALAVPEPSSLSLLGLATLGLVSRRRRS